ncbi:MULTISPECIES: DUF2268 domain-containing putative Zn-dependent protease [Bacillaceae]|uniref:DUF2268 domain-containing protein n=1 Tax=Niallia alba TaxID=2729105 RepID=A0A7Y0PMA6_9BACI|nr:MULTISPECIES: DUF2268 domain-containing putative Zn-dependent protease [Bacillaceae]MBZ9536220.1 Zn-dependent protease [Cytobacillus oceanisediminis]NMO77570.1 DUF2268 domain-containing protein [Niallia alba]
MQKPGVLVILLFFLLLISCEQKETIKEEKESDDIYYSFKHPETGQEYQIVHAYKLYENYENRIREDSSKPNFWQFDEEVIEPIVDACYQDAVFFAGNFDLTVKAPENMEEINEIIKIMDEKKLNKTIQEALLKSSDYISSENKTNICIFPVEEDQITHGMDAWGAGKISVYYNKYYSEEFIKTTIAHEYNHSVWFEKYYKEDEEETVLDRLILEGKAVMFQKLVYPDIEVENLYYNFKKDFWKQIEPDLQTYDLKRASEILNGGDKLPPNYGYSEGYNMVRTYLNKHPDLTPEEWTGLTSQEIFEEGNYIEHYQ